MQRADSPRSLEETKGLFESHEVAHFKNCYESIIPKEYDQGLI